MWNAHCHPLTCVPPGATSIFRFSERDVGTPNLEWICMATIWSKKDMRNFQEAVQSLKLYRRAELVDPDKGSPLIDSLYVDPLPEEQVFRTILRPHTTFLIGRKGTGKSTIFQRLQSELRKTQNRTSAYIDIKTVYESSQMDPELLARLKALEGAMPPAALERLLLYKEFLRAVVVEIKSELEKRVKASIWTRIREKVSGTMADLFVDLDQLLQEANEERFISVLGLYTAERRDRGVANQQTATSRAIAGSLGVASTVSVSASDTAGESSTSESESTYSDLLLRAFNVKELISKLKDLLAELDIRNLYVLIDDFSELPRDAMQVVVDVLLAPLNNWSDEFVKFKVAAYPGRIYYGAIDKTKIDEVYLDLFKLYGGGDISRMEDSAIDFTRRLVESRVRYFCKKPAAEFFESDENEIWKHLFFATMANPRNLGYVLHYVQESHLIRGKRIGVSAIQEAAERYYEEKIESYFTIGKFLHEDMSERASIFSLKELLEAIVARARELRTHESQVMKKIKGRPPTSHFHVPIAYESLFSTLELNFFLTKYFEMTDRSARKVTVFALNYGLCSKYSIIFGRPIGEREFRLYFVERFFDYSPILRAYLAKNQEIVCDTCGHRYSFENLEALRFFGMLCKECKTGTVRVTNLSQKYAKELAAVSQDMLLPGTELGILQTLHSEGAALRAGFIAGELDCSHQLIGKRGVKLADRGLVKRYQDEQKNRLFEITDLAQESYFAEGVMESLDIPLDPSESGGSAP
jgi:Cdc6-like AAA superfamily ATPase/DNA-binding MarR family transcriptional regulator